MGRADVGTKAADEGAGAHVGHHGEVGQGQFLIAMACHPLQQRLQRGSRTGGCGDLWGTGLTANAYAINSRTAPAGAGFTWGGNTILNSFHTGGINVMLGDGSVRFVADNVDFNTFQRACARDDGFANTLP